MSNVPIAGQPSLSPNANGTSPSVCIRRASATELVERCGRLVAAIRPDALLVEHDPRVRVERHEVRLAVGGGRRELRAFREVALDVRPDVGERRGEALGGEEPHPVAGEPREDVVGVPWR
jgi:hypothetical protein